MMASLVRPIAVRKSGCGAGIGAAADPVDDVLQRKFEIVGLVQGDFQHARNDLHGRRQGSASARRER